MCGDGQLPVSLFDFELGGRWRNAERVIVGRINNHGGEKQRNTARHPKRPKSRSLAVTEPSDVASMNEKIDGRDGGVDYPNFKIRVIDRPIVCMVVT